MKAVLMTREYPPHVYGGAGVHVEFLARELARSIDVEVRCFGEQDASAPRLRVRGYPDRGPFAGAAPGGPADALSALYTDLLFAAEPIEADVVHCHTWYAHFAGTLAQICWDTPLVVTVHSLEPLRPWKRERLGRGYDLSRWVERTTLERAEAVICVSRRDRDEMLRHYDVRAERTHVVPNGVDTEAYRPVSAPARVRALGVDPDATYVLFLGRVSRQKGITHFLAAADRLPPEVGVVVCASAADAPAVEREVREGMERLGRRRRGVVRIDRHLSREDAVALYSHAAVFCCPSVYEPFGLINLEAMACETPVVASRVGGIPDVVVDGETGVLVDIEPAGDGSGEPADPAAFHDALARALSALLLDPSRRDAMGRAGRRHVRARFGWDVVAAQVIEVYGEAARRRRASS